jgi:hypothetical protein
MADFTKRISGSRFSGFSGWLFSEQLWFPWLHSQRLLLDRDLGTGYLVKCRPKR